MKQIFLALASLVFASAVAAGDTSPQKLLHSFEAISGSKASAVAGNKLFTSKHTGGKPDTPSCITCHTTNLKGMGQTRVGKPIDPMAISANPNRLTDQKKVAKWFRRNCKTVLGRECSAKEKSNIIAYFLSL